MSLTFIMDTEADGLLDTITQFWCLVFKEQGVERYRIFSDHCHEWKGHHVYPTSLVSTMLNREACRIVGHNIMDFDLRAMQRLLNIDFSVSPDVVAGKNIEIVDTLVWSRYLKPDRLLPKGCPTTQWNEVEKKNNLVGPHSLAAWSYKTGGKKPIIDDWRNLPIEDYIERCVEDTRNNDLVYVELLKEIESLSGESIDDYL